MKRILPSLIILASLLCILLCILTDCCTDCNEECPDPYNPDCPEYDSCLTFPVKCAYNPKGRVSKDSIPISWSTGSDIPVGQGWAAASILDMRIYVSGGINPETGVSNLVQIYDPVLDSWTISDQLLQRKRWGHSSNTVEGSIYVMGGCDSAKGPAISIIEVFNPETGTWEEKGEMPYGRIGHGSVTYQGKIYIMGGEIKEPDLTVMRTVEAFNPSENSWETLAPMPTPRIFMAVCILDGKIYAIGGGKKYPYSGITTIEAYNIAEDSWTRKADLKIGLGDLTASVVNNKIYCAGGWTLWTGDATPIVQVYDPQVDSVYLATDMQVNRMAGSAIALDDRVYIISGVRTIKPEFSLSPNIDIGTVGLK